MKDVLSSRWSWFFLCMLAGLYLLVGYQLIPVGADDLRMVNVFSIDEADIVAHIWNLYVTDFETPPSFKYGGAFYIVPVLAMYVWSILGEITEHVSIIAIRSYCFVSGIGCLWLTYLLGQRVFHQFAGLSATIMLGVSPTFLRWSVESHPDLPQLFFLLLSLWSVCKYLDTPTIWWICVASLGAGVAFAIKYAGIFLLPVLFLAVFMNMSQAHFLDRFKDLSVWKYWGIILITFLATFFVFNPSVLVNFPEFIQSLQVEKETMSFGHRVRVTTGAWTWLQMLGNQMGIFSLVVAGVGLCLWGMGKRHLKTEHIVLLAWVVVFLGYLMFESNLKRARHLLPILPVVLVFVGAAYWEVWGRLSTHLGVPIKVQALVLLVVVIFSWPQIQASANLYDQKKNRESERVEIEAGRWLAENYSDDITALFDAYAYIPSQFSYAFRSVGMDYIEVNHFEPDVLVVRDAIVADFANLAEAKDARIGELAFKDRHYFYLFLEAGKLPDYQLKHDFGSVAIYDRTTPKTRKSGDLRNHWRRLLSDYIQQRRYGVVEALWTMGQVHMQEGQDQMAQEAFSRAQQSKNFTKRIYSHGVRLLKQGREDASRQALQAALYTAQSETIAFQAGMREDLAYRYFEAGQYQEMLQTAQEALSLTNNLPTAAFEVATAHLALGNLEQGTALFENAVAKYSTHEKGKVLLELLMARGKAEQVVDKLRKKYYTP